MRRCRHDDARSRFSQFCYCAYERVTTYPVHTSDFPQANCKTMIQGAPLLQRKDTITLRCQDVLPIPTASRVRRSGQQGNPPMGHLANNVVAFLPNSDSCTQIFTIFRISPSLPRIPTNRQVMATDAGGWVV